MSKKVKPEMLEAIKEAVEGVLSGAETKISCHDPSTGESVALKISRCDDEDNILDPEVFDALTNDNKACDCGCCDNHMEVVPEPVVPFGQKLYDQEVEEHYANSDYIISDDTIRGKIDPIKAVCQFTAPTADQLRYEQSNYPPELAEFLVEAREKNALIAKTVGVIAETTAAMLLEYNTQVTGLANNYTHKSMCRIVDKNK